MVTFKGKKVLSFALIFAVLATMITVTSPVLATGEVLWSQDFDGLEESPWDYTLWGEEAYKNANSVEIIDGKLVVTKNQLAGTSVDTDYINITVPLSASGEFETPDSGYLAFDFDYEQNINWVDDNHYSNLMLVNEENANIAGFGFGNATTGLRIIAGNEEPSSVEYENVAPASTYIGQTVSVRLLFDLDQDTYQVFYTPEGRESVEAFDPLPIPSVSEETLEGGEFDLNNLRFTLACVNETETNGEPVTMTFDNFALTAFNNFALMSVATEAEPDVPTVEYTTIVETDMGLTEPLKVVFSAPIAFETLNNVTLHKGTVDGPAVELTPSIATDGVATYFSHTLLDYATTYVLNIPNTVKSTTNGSFAGATYTFTTISRTSQHEKVMWFEDFDTRVGWDTAERNAGWGIVIAEVVDGEEISMGTAENIGDRDNADRAKIEFREGGLMITSPQNIEGTAAQNIARITIPFTGYNRGKADYVAVEFDYLQNSAFSKKYTEDIIIRNSQGQFIFKSNFGSELYGYQYTTYDGLRVSDYVSYPDFYNKLSAYDSSGNGYIGISELPTKTISDNSSHWVGVPVKVQILFDVPNKKYTVNYISNGTRYQARTGWEDMVPDFEFDLDKITFKESCESADASEVVVKFDNLSIVEYYTPKVSQTSVDELENIEIDEPVTIQFSERMNEESLENITLMKGSTPVEISNIELSLDGKTVTLLHNELENGTEYSLIVPTTVISEDYFAIEEDYSISFTTMAVGAPPEVKKVSIASGATEVELDEEFTITFNKAMDVQSMGNVTLTSSKGSVDLDVQMTNNSKTATFTHDGLEYQTDYTLTIPTTVKAQDGTFATEEIIYTFTSKTAPTPPVVVSASITNGQTGVPVTSEFSFKFDKAMDASTFENITLMQGETRIPLYVYVENGNRTVRLDHNKLQNDTEYTLTIPTTVKSIIGLGVESNKVYNFRTVSSVEGETLLYGEYFDSAIGGASGTQAQYSDGNWNIYTMCQNVINYSDTNKVEFKDGKMVVTKEQRIADAASNNRINATLDLSTAADMPATGVVAIEYDIKYSKKPAATMWYTDTAVSTSTTGAAASEITRLSFASGNHGWKDKSVYNDIYKDIAITSTDWLEGKDIHVKLVYNLDERNYCMFYTVDGVTYQSPVGVAPFREEIPNEKIKRLTFSYTYTYADADPVIITLDNIEVKKLTKPVIDIIGSSVVNGQTGVAATGKIKVAFNSSMNTNSFKDIKIYEGGIAPENLVPTTSVVADENSCYVYFDKGLKYSTKYIINVPSSVASSNLVPVSATNITFTTEAPVVGYDVLFNTVQNSSGIEIADIRGLTSVKAEVKFTNNMCAYLKSPKLVVALCDGDGNIKSISYRETPVLLGANKIVTVSFTSSTPFELGDYLKAYVLDGQTGRLLSPEVIY